MSDHAVKSPKVAEDAPRKVELTVARVDAWSVTKISFLLSVAAGIATVVLSIVLWFVLDGMHVFSAIEDFMTTLGAERFTKLLDFVRLPQVISYATVIAVVNVVLITAISTLGALLYNVCATLVGGVKVSLMDE